MIARAKIIKQRIHEMKIVLQKGICISRPPALCLAPGPGPQFVFTSLGPQLYLPGLATNLYLPALAPNLYLPALAPNLYLPALTPNLCLPQICIYRLNPG